MLSASRTGLTIILLFPLILGASFLTTRAQIPGQFAQDFIAGKVPSEQEIQKLERDVAERPEDFRLVRKLGKAYFFQVFGEGRSSAAPKSQKLLERALDLKKNDAETIAYLGSLAAILAQRSKDANERETGNRRAIEYLKKARELEPDNIAVLAITGASYLFLPDSFGTAPLAAESMERIRARMGPMFARMSHHGQQRVLLTQGQAYVRMGQLDKARACFEDALKVDEDSVEAVLIKAELNRLRSES